MKYLFLFIIITLIHCNKDLVQVGCCNKDNLINNNPTFIDLVRYFIRNDSTSIFGIASSIKSVPNQGEIDWMANNSIQYMNNEFYLIFKNYSDTEWVDLEWWANRREVIVIKLSQLNGGVYQIMNEASYLNNMELDYAVYNKFIDEYHDATWDVDISKVNYIDITSIDSTNRVIEGKFELNFIIKKQSTLPTDIHSDIIRFRCGHFRVHQF